MHHVGRMMLGTGAAGFSPATLFANGEKGFWFDPSDLSTLFQDTAGTVPVTAAGQSVARMNDKSGNGHHATQATAGSRPILRQTGALYYLEFDGADDSMVTGTITPGTDKLQIFSGVRKVVDQQGCIAELSANSAANVGTFYHAASGGGLASYFNRSIGTLSSDTSSPISYPAPITNVLAAICEIQTDTNILRVNGVQVSSSAGDQGTGNYLAYPLYLGRRGGTTQAFNGHLYGLIGRFGANLTAGQITAAEGYVAKKTGVTL